MKNDLEGCFLSIGINGFVITIIIIIVGIFLSKHYENELASRNIYYTSGNEDKLLLITAGILSIVPFLNLIIISLMFLYFIVKLNYYKRRLNAE